MTLFANLRVRVIRDVVAMVRRELPGKGQILVQVGQEVSSHEILGRSEVSAGFRSINLAQALSVPPKKVQDYLQCRIGQTIYKGELLAFKKGSLFSSPKIVTAPTDGILELVDTSSGEAKITFLPHQMELPAAVFGIVEAVDNDHGAVLIKTQVTQIYGLFGSGKVREGNLRVLGGRGDLISKIRITPDLTNQILIGGGLIFTSAISQAVMVGAVGLITGGINSKDFKSIFGGRLTYPPKFGTDIGIGILICEGFGSIPIGEDIFEVIRTYDGQFAILEGNRARLSIPSLDSDCLVRIRKIKLPKPTLMVEPLLEVEAIQLKVGQRVRIIGPFIGEQGEVVAVDQQATMLLSKIRTYLITVKAKRRTLRVPYCNVEVIG